MKSEDMIIGRGDPILITGSAGFIGSRVVATLLERKFTNLRCLVRTPASRSKLKRALRDHPGAAGAQIIEGNLLSEDDCAAAAGDAAVIYHLAAARGEKSFPDAFMNSVVTTRNLLRSTLQRRALRRFVNVSSFSVYANRQNTRRGVLDETCPVEPNPGARGDAYCYAKVRQEDIVIQYGMEYRIPYVIVRPGFVFGPGNEAITGRVGLGGFGIFLHLGGGNRIPFTYVDNCADAIVLAGLRKGAEGEAFNVVDDHPPTSRKFLWMYKRNVERFRSLYLPHWLSFLLCFAWERYSAWSEGQLPPAYNRMSWHAYWKKTRYSNQKLKDRLGWYPKVPMAEAFERYFESCRAKRAQCLELQS